MLSIIFAESALETIPKPLQHHKSVMIHARKLGKYPDEILLDNSWHFAAMKGIDNEIKRGRPDIVHFNLLEATTIPLYHTNQMKIYVHTINNKVITIGDNVHLPKSYHRFEGLIEKLYLEKKIKNDTRTLLEIENMTFPQLIQKIDPDQVIGLSIEGHNSSLPDVAKKIDDETCLVIGSFQKGHFEDSIKNCIDQLYNINESSLESHIVTSRILYEYEKTLFI